MLLSIASFIESSATSFSTCPTETSPSGAVIGGSGIIRLEATQTHPARSSVPQISLWEFPSHDGSSHGTIRGQHGQPSMDFSNMIPSL